MSKKLVIIVALVGVLLLGGMGAMFYVMWSKLTVLSAATLPPESAEEGSEAGEAPTMGPVFSLDAFIVNLADPGGKRFLRTTIDMELVAEDSVAEMERRMPQIRDSILMILPTRRAADLMDVDGKHRLRDEILDAINGFFPEPTVRTLYFTEFVIQ